MKTSNKVIQYYATALLALLFCASTHADNSGPKCPEGYVKHYPGNVCQSEKASKTLAFDVPLKESCPSGYERIDRGCFAKYTDVKLKDGVVLVDQRSTKGCNKGVPLQENSRICLRDTLKIDIKSRYIGNYGLLVEPRDIPNRGMDEPWAILLCEDAATDDLPEYPVGGGIFFVACVTE